MLPHCHGFLTIFEPVLHWKICPMSYLEKIIVPYTYLFILIHCNYSLIFLSCVSICLYFHPQKCLLSNIVISVFGKGTSTKKNRILQLLHWQKISKQDFPLQLVWQHISIVFHYYHLTVLMTQIILQIFCICISQIWQYERGPQ